MKTLVTGVAGCIGSDLAEALVARGDEVTGIDNLSSGKMEHISALLGHQRFRFIEGDLENVAAVEAAMTGVEFVWHFAANPDVKFIPGDPTDKDLRQNTLCTYNVLETMRRLKVPKLAFSSTSAVYGISKQQPIPEDAPFPQPISLYGATKLSCESMISAFQNLFSMQCWIFRFANIVGPKVRKRGRTVIGDFVIGLIRDPRKLVILGDGKQAKSYLLAEECIEAMLFVVQHAQAGLNVFNLGCDDSLCVTTIADLVVEAMGLQDVRYEFTGGEGGWPGDVPRFLLDVSAINRLGWKARHNSRDAVTRAVRSTLVLMTNAPAAGG
ncbi:MAG TPA: NAD-dependent epimerase/dehydratase family protein [Bryobacteraceae bacterium]|nr:NAD-dependent epimerase/dehydratase family protein [Bryobacteraceae bacterium]